MGSLDLRASVDVLADAAAAGGAAICAKERKNCLCGINDQIIYKNLAVFADAAGGGGAATCAKKILFLCDCLYKFKFGDDVLLKTIPFAC